MIDPVTVRSHSSSCAKVKQDRGQCIGTAPELWLPLDKSFTSRLLRLSANTILVTALLPYISPFVVANLDVQLMGSVAASIVLLLLMFVTPWRLRFHRTDLYIFAIGLFTLVYVNPTLPGADFETSLRSCAPITLGFPVYFAVRCLYRYMSPRVFIGVVVFYFVILLIQLGSPDIYQSLFGSLLSDARYAPEEGRGPNGLTPEPAMMGKMCVMFVVSLYFFQRDYWARNRTAAGFVIAVSATMLLITKSAMGVMLSLAVAIAALLSSGLKVRAKAATISAVLVAVVVVGELLSFSDSRGAMVLSLMAENPSLVFQDHSFVARITNIFVGIYQLPDAPLGNGDVRPNIDLTDRALSSDMAILIWPDYRLRSLMVDVVASRDNVSGIGGMIQRMGLFGILAPLLLVLFIPDMKGKWVVRIFVVGLFLNASLVISTLWFILGCCAEAQKPALNSREKELLPGVRKEFQLEFLPKCD